MSVCFYTDLVTGEKMRQFTVWFRRQWMERAFRIWIAFFLILTFVMMVEFHLFQYGHLKRIRYLVLFWSLGLIAWDDRKSRRISNRILLFLLAVRTVLLALECLVWQEYWMSLVISAAAGLILSGGMFLICYVIAKGGIGAGDVKLLAVLGYWMGGGAVFTAIFLTVLSAAVYSGIGLFLRKVSLKQEMPFAPFVLAGTILTIMLGV